jgi:drug/metabolite transporter (DMT)-like permease
MQTAGQNTSTAGAFSDALLLGGMIVLWGLSWPVMKLAVLEAPPLWLAAIRFASSGLCLFALNAVRREVRVPTLPDLPIVLSIGLLQMAAFTGLGMIAMQFIDAGRASVLAYSTPLWAVLIAAILYRERPTPLQLVAVATGMSGIVILCSPVSLNWSSSSVPLGAGLLVTAAICWSVVILHVRRHRWKTTPLQLAPWEMALASLVLVPLAWVMEGPPTSIRWSPHLLLLIIYFGPVATSFCFVVSTEVGRRISTFTMSNLTLGVPVIGTFVSVLLLGETLSFLASLGFSLIMSGIVIAAWAVRMKARINSRTRERDEHQKQAWPVERV